MNYTIAIMEDVQGVIRINLDKPGNEYLVGLYNKETKEYSHNTFSNINEANDIFQKLSSAIITGAYSYEQRKQMLFA